MLNTELLFNKIEELRQEYLDFLIEVVSTESPTNNKEQVDKVGKLFIDKATKKGLDVEIFSQSVSGDVVKITLNKGNEKPFCISGHLDTVHAVGAFGETVKILENKIIAPGIADCKGGCVCGLWALDALKQCGYSGRPIMLLLQTDEETGSKGSNRETINYICENSKDAVGFLNLEPCSKFTAVTLERKGITRFAFNIKGKPAHASVCWSGANAILEASHKIIEIEKIKDKNGITCNCGVIKGGTVLNTVPDHCTFSVDVRFFTVEEYEEITLFMENLAQTNFVEGTVTVLEKGSWRPAMPRTKTNEEFLAKINKILQDSGLETLDGVHTFGGSDASYITEMGVPVVDSIGILGAGAHSLSEYAKLDTLTTAPKRIAAIINGL